MYVHILYEYMNFAVNKVSMYLDHDPVHAMYPMTPVPERCSVIPVPERSSPVDLKGAV